VPTPPHPIHRRYLAEDLVRLRRPDEQQRYAASQRRGRIDANPHQIDAVIFALRRIPEGGCILADEVGLGKTIEAGLVIAQLLAEGKSRILIIVPKTLLGQWRDELYSLFGMEAEEGGSLERLDRPGIFLFGREQAGSERGSRLLRQASPFDLCVIDEAHEIFAAIYKRFDRNGCYNPDSNRAKMAGRVRRFLGRGTPVLLLTATPIQNSLAELWGLVQYVEPTGTLLGSISTFRKLFASGDDRSLEPGQAPELQRRLATVCQRTLRRQAQEFLTRPFVERRAQLFLYTMTEAERELYDDVTEYLLEPDLCAFQGSHRRLLLIGFHRRMASSLPALAASLDRVAARLRALLAGTDCAAIPDLALDFARDLEDELEAEEETVPELEPPATGLVESELARVEELARRARSLPADSKAEALLRAVDLILKRGPEAKVVIFTESLTTQEYLQELLRGAGLDITEITLFRGQNTSPRAVQALQHWQDEVGTMIPAYQQPSRAVAIRLALVHEHRSRSRVLISTEAGAKGLNLQYCDTIINYDLPWNPQRIEQRIGRCHRYGQQHGVTVINFLAEDNEAQRLTFDILSKKLELFGTVLDASDCVLHQSESDSGGAPETIATALGADFEARLHQIYQRARSLEQIEHELRLLRDEMTARRRRFEEEIERTAGLIESRLDETVRGVLCQIRDNLPAGLARLDQDLERLLIGYLQALGIEHRSWSGEGRHGLTIEASPRLPEELCEGTTVVIGQAGEIGDAEPLHLGHPLIQAAVAEARQATSGRQQVRFVLASSAADALRRYQGRRGRLVVTKITYQGYEPEQRLVVTALLEGDDDPLPEAEARLIMSLPATTHPVFEPAIEIDPEDLEDAVEEGLFLDQSEVADAEQARFERMIEQIECYLEDQAIVLRSRRTEHEQKLVRARTQRDAALGAEDRARAERQLDQLQSELDEIESDLERLEARQDDEYERWRQQALQRRYSKPECERVLDIELVLKPAAGKPGP
jgi:superfamily II DNA or RNA helicase